MNKQSQEGVILSVIIPVRSLNEPYLEECLRSLGSSLGLVSEILVIEGGNLAQARNLGVNLARGHYIGFIDSDCEARAGWPCSLIQHLEKDKSLGGVGGPNLSHPSDPALGRALDILFSTYLGSLRSACFYRPSRPYFAKSIACINSVFRRKALEDARGFDERFELNEDTSLGYRVRAAGYGLLQVPDDLVWHHRRGSIGAFAKQMYNYGKGRVRSIFTDKAYADWRILAAPLGLVLWVVSLLMSFPLAVVLLISYLAVRSGYLFAGDRFPCRLRPAWFGSERMRRIRVDYRLLLR